MEDGNLNMLPQKLLCFSFNNPHFACWAVPVVINEMRGIHLCFAPAASVFSVGHISVAQLNSPTNISEIKGSAIDTENKKSTKNINSQK